MIEALSKESPSGERLTLADLVIKAKENANNHGWKITQETVPTYLMLIVSECSEAMDAWRDKKPIGEELSDIVIRVAHMAGDLEVDLAGEVEAKMARNENRPYHHGRARI